MPSFLLSIPYQAQLSNSWNPLELVEAILADVQKGTKPKDCPDSRYVTRIIPLQATCFASLDDMQTAVKGLLKALLVTRVNKDDDVEENGPKKDDTTTDEGCGGTLGATTKRKTTTFAIQEKRRNCGHLKREAMIDAIATVVGDMTREAGGGEWKVDLKRPDYTVWVEVCKTLCGISIVPRQYLEVAPNFNMAELRDQQQSSRRDDDDDK
jgi:tRNA(Ser,Leu) C12 N-acetylase TAN1